MGKEKTEEYARSFFRNSTKQFPSPIRLLSSDKLPKINEAKSGKYIYSQGNNLENYKIQETHSTKQEDKTEFPRLELDYSNQSKTNQINRIIITPNSINKKTKVKGKKFYFGSANGSKCIKNNITRENSEKILNDATSPLDYTFEDKNMGYHQFEISFNAEKSKYYILENKQGTGTFVKIKTKLAVNRDMIISFCSCHMVLQVSPDGIYL